MNKKKTSLYPVNEILYLFRSEGPWIGQPMVVVRMVGGQSNKAEAPEPCEMLTPRQIVDRIWGVAPVNTPVFFEGCGTSAIDHRLVVFLTDELQCELHLETDGVSPAWWMVSFTSIMVCPSLPVRLLSMGNRTVEIWGRMRCKMRSLKIVFDPSPSFHLGEMMEEWGRMGWERQYLVPLSGDTQHDVMEYVRDHPEWSLLVQWNN